METPSSTARRVTRSQTLAASNVIPVSRKTEDSDKNMSKSRQRTAGGQQQQQDRSALIDITNDSPIVGLANGGNLAETPLAGKQRGSGRAMKKTPGSGEALLRGQVKTLLQKVEEEAVLSKISLETRPFLQLVNSPLGLLAPTPANTPQIPNLSGFSADSASVLGSSVTLSQIVQEQLISQVVNHHVFDVKKNEEDSESEKSLITRSLLLDFSEKSEVSDASEECCSELSYQGCMEKAATEDDDASVWSIQVNASTHDEEDEDEEVGEEDEEEFYYDDDEEEEDECEVVDGGLMLDELCEGLNNISMNGTKFEGKHTRFVYNSDDELIKEEEASSSPNVMRLKGLPTPKGKHFRFSEEEEEGH